MLLLLSWLVSQKKQKYQQPYFDHVIHLLELGKFMYYYKHSLLPLGLEMLMLLSYPSVEQTLDNFL